MYYLKKIKNLLYLSKGSVIDMATATPLASNDISIDSINHRYFSIDGKNYFFEYTDIGSGLNRNTSFCILEGGTGTTQMSSGSSPGSPKNVVNGANRNGDSDILFVNSATGTTGLCGDIVDEIAAATGADRTDRIYMGHSASGFQVTTAANNFLQSERDAGKETKTMLVLNDPTYGGVDPILRDGSKAENFEDSYVVSMGPIGLGYSGKIKKDDITSLAQAGARILLIGGPNGWHTEYNDRVSPALGLYSQHTVNLAGFKGLTFWTVDSNGKPTKISLEEAQTYNDASVGRLDMFNQGFLSHATGEYVITSGEFSFAISDEELEKMTLNFERSGESFEDYLLKNYTVDREGNLLDQEGNIVGTTRGTPNNDNVPPTLAEVGKACDALLASLNSIGKHMESFGNIKGLNNRPKENMSDYLSGMNAFPSGINSSGLQTCMEDCVNSLGKNLEAAYNATANLYSTMAQVENAASSYYPSSTYSNAGNSANSNAGNFASDVI